MTITPTLNLTFPIRVTQVERPDPDTPGATISVAEPLVYVYHVPISEAVFEQNFRLIEMTKSELWAGPPGVKEKDRSMAALERIGIAKLLLLDNGKRLAEQYETQDTAPALLLELQRLTTVIASGPNGFEPVPIDLAQKRGLIDADEWNEAMAILVFFTVTYAMARRRNRERILDFTALVCGGSSTSSSLTDFLASLTPSTVRPTSDERIPSLVPS